MTKLLLELWLCSTSSDMTYRRACGEEVMCSNAMMHQQIYVFNAVIFVTILADIAKSGCGSLPHAPPPLYLFARLSLFTTPADDRQTCLS